MILSAMFAYPPPVDTPLFRPLSRVFDPRSHRLFLPGLPVELSQRPRDMPSKGDHPIVRIRRAAAGLVFRQPRADTASEHQRVRPSEAQRDAGGEGREPAHYRELRAGPSAHVFAKQLVCPH